MQSLKVAYNNNHKLNAAATLTMTIQNKSIKV
jgi:hypothetical protein